MKKAGRAIILGGVVLSVAGMGVYFYTGQISQTKEAVALGNVPKSQDVDGKGEQPEITNLSLQPYISGRQSEDLLERDCPKHQRAETARQEPEPTVLTPAKKGETTIATEMTPSEFVDALRHVVAKNPDEMEALLAQAPKSVECVQLLKRFVLDPSTSADLRQYLIKALAQISTRESVGFLLDQLLAAATSGDANTSKAIMRAIVENPTSTDGSRELFDLLLGTGRYDTYRDNLPDDIRLAVRKALRNVQDREAVSDLATSLYLDPNILVRRDALMELFDGIAAPLMLGQLSVQAYQNGRAEASAQFMDRIEQDADQGAVQAFAQIASAEPALLSDAADRLYAWSRAHPDEAKPGLFLEYLNDVGRPPEERIVAAYGIAGCADRAEADRTIRKALVGETNTNVIKNLQSALSMLMPPVNAPVAVLTGAPTMK